MKRKLKRNHEKILCRIKERTRKETRRTGRGNRRNEGENRRIEEKVGEQER